MNANLSDITIVLDRSGSMASVADDTIGGFNQFLVDQKKAPGQAKITLHQFDDVFETPIPTTDIQNALPLTGHTFVPRGNTALLDAIGRGIGETGARLGAAPENDRAGKVIFVIITDGNENASHEYDRAKVFQMIDHQRSVYSWEFVFLGANQDAIAAAAAIGIHAANAMTYAHNAVGTQAAFQAVSSNARNFRGGQSAGMGYSTAQREAQKRAGAKH